MNPEEVESKKIPINWEVPNSIVTRFVNNVTVQSSEDYFTISFFEIVHPLIIGTSEEVAKQVENIESIKAVCVGKFVIPASVYPSVVQLMNDKLKRNI